MFNKWHNINKKKPKITDYYNISDGARISIGIYYSDEQKFYDISKMPLKNIKYWTKIAELPCDDVKEIPPFMFQ